MMYYGGKDLARSFGTVRKNTLIIAEEIPEEQYDFRAVEGTRSVRQMLAHLFVLSQAMFGGHAVRKITSFDGVDLRAVIAERQAEERRWGTASKRDLLEALGRDGDEWAAFLEQVSEDELGARVTFPPPADPPSKSRFEILLANKEHEMHHRAQLMLIERLLGLVPHLTRERQARFGGLLDAKR